MCRTQRQKRLHREANERYQKGFRAKKSHARRQRQYRQKRAQKKKVTDEGRPPLAPSVKVCAVDELISASIQIVLFPSSESSFLEEVPPFHSPLGAGSHPSLGVQPEPSAALQCCKCQCWGQFIRTEKLSLTRRL